MDGEDVLPLRLSRNRLPPSRSMIWTSTRLEAWIGSSVALRSGMAMFRFDRSCSAVSPAVAAGPAVAAAFWAPLALLDPLDPPQAESIRAPLSTIPAIRYGRLRTGVI